ncbi:S-layer homology domain-containing protein [Paenibacillus sp. sptzw28]|uniref:S-layer homology domain-containing protein n=1 Tax=Paenibacillus sp. sptzw28 TaxID=715179 RepID=UPI001C6E85D7|nr:S-layer homology domain-containing protein [Paenibacillus sp. sptzw28]QYR22092.1 S-layer homology domain-containing protein [Paenibacillus sp. sptzw28]
MRETSEQYFKQNSQQPKHFRGGEKKVMKKSLAVIVAGAMAFSMFASAAFAADAKEMSALDKFNALKEAGIFSGYPGGGAGLENEMTRAEFAKVLTKLEGLTENGDAAKAYSDVSATHWARGFIGAVTEDGIMNGLGGGKFGPSGKVTIEQIAKVADEVAGIEKSDAAVSGKVSAWAKGYVAAAIEAGLIAEMPSYQVNATREMLVNVAYDLAQGGDQVVTVKSVKVVDEKNIEVTFSDNEVVKKTLDTALVAGQTTKVSVDYKGKTYQVDVKLDVLKATDAKQTGAKKITVNFNQPVLASDKTALTYELKYGLTPYPVTAEYATDGKSAVLTAAYLPTGDYTLTVKGSDAISLKVEAEKATKIDVTVPALTYANNVDLGVKTYNQFSEEMTASPTISVYNVTKSKSIGVSGGKVNLLTDASIGDSINVTAVYPSAGLSVNKTLKVINGSAATSIKIDPVKPLTGKDRISVGQTGFVLPVTLVDANGQTIKLPTFATKTLATNQNSFDLAGLIFYVSDPAIVNDIAVDSNGVITFNTEAKAGTAYITITNGATGAYATTSVVVNGLAQVKDFQLSHPGKTIVQGEDIVFPFTAVDTYGAAVAGKDLDLSKVTFYGPSGLTYKVNAKGELVFNFAQTGAYTIYTLVNNIQQPSTVQVNVMDPAYFTAVNGIKDVATTYEVGASNAFDADNITVVDNYGRVSNVTASTYTVVSDDPSIVSYAGGKLVANKAGSTTITVNSSANANITAYKFTVNVVASSDIKTYAIDTVGTLYGKSTLTDSSAYAKQVTLIGKTASGTSVALVNNVAPFVTSSDETVLAVSNSKTATVYGLKAGKSTLAAYNASGTKLAEQEVTVSEDAPVAKTAAFSADEYSVKVGQQVTVAVTVKDQYGVVITPANQLSSADTSVATATGFTITGVKVGSTTLTYVSSNGTTDTATIVVNP